MLSNREILLCRYHYDPLDRLVDCTPAAQANTRRFYLKDRLATEIQGAVQRSVMQHEDQLLAQQQRQSGTLKTTLVATDQQRSVLSALDTAPPRHLAYTAYGHRSPESGLLSLLGFNGERPDPVTGCYLLGNGYRAFNPVLMRFNSPDSWSPFGEGGLNAYAYCVGDPVNLEDPTGHIGNPFKGLLNILGRTPSRARAPAETVPPRHEARTLASLPNSPAVELPPYSTMESYARSRPRPPAYDMTSAPSYDLPRVNQSGPPPAYGSDIQPPALSQHRRSGLIHKLNRSSEHLQRVEENTRNLPSFSPSIDETTRSLISQINLYRSDLGLPPLYRRHQVIRES